MEEENIRRAVRNGYARIARNEKRCCVDTASCEQGSHSENSKRIGYSDKEINSVPEGANLGLGCGNPLALASLKKGETVLDLGSGGGFDCFLAANKVGKDGKVIGVDMTPEMIDKARRNARKGKYANAEFRLGEIENLPVADNTVDIVISNCVINLSPNKKRVFEEAFRVLKPKGRLMISDIVLSKELPEIVKKNVQAYIGCLSGAEMKNKYLKMIEDSGFQEVKVIDEKYFPPENIADNSTAQSLIHKSKISAKRFEEIIQTVASVKVSAIKPKN